MMTKKNPLDHILDDVELPSEKEIQEATRRLKITRHSLSFSNFKKKEVQLKAKNTRIQTGSTIVNDEQRKEIFYNSWGKDRGSSYNKKIVKKYKVKALTVKSFTGQEAAIRYNEDYDKLQQEWKDKYNPGWILRSPGNDLLDYYDEINELRHNNQKILLPPSVVYYYRFTKPDWTNAEVYEKFPHIKPNTLLALLRKRLAWLVDHPHTVYEFENRQQMVDWCQTEFKNGNAIREIADPSKGTAGMAWKGKMAGWSIIRK